jgi:hypothetical protein
MAQGKVSVNNGNLNQGGTPDIEKKALFIGVGATNKNATLSLNAQSDLDIQLGAADSDIKTQVAAAQANGGDLWEAYARPVDAADAWEDEVDVAMETISPEFIVLCTPAISSAELDACQTKAESLRTTLARRVAIVTATAGIDAGTDTWSVYEAEQAAITSSVAAYRIGAVPLLHGNDLGVVMGRLCRADLSIADSPMRVASGPVVALGATPVDVNGVELTDATLATLDSNRLSCIQHYVDYPGAYWGDLNLLDVPGGDYQVIEYLRPVDKAARKVRLIEIAMIANRSINSTPISQASTKNKLMKPLRDMSKSTVFLGTQFPGEIEPPTDESVKLVWKSKTELETYLSVKPYDAPKKIITMIFLDLSNPTA